MELPSKASDKSQGSQGAPSVKVLEAFISLLKEIEDNHRTDRPSELKCLNEVVSANQEDASESKLTEIFGRVPDTLKTEDGVPDQTLLSKLCNYMEIVCEGLTHLSHRKEIYGDDLGKWKGFLKSLLQGCGKMAENCFEHFKRNWSLLSPESISGSAADLFEVTIATLILATSQGTVLPGVAKFLVLILKPLKSSLTAPHVFGAQLLAHLKQLVEEVVFKSDEPEKGQAEAKRANYFGKIVVKFCGEFRLGSDWTVCFSNAVQIAKIIESTVVHSEILSCYPQLLTDFFVLEHFSTKVLETAFMDLDWNMKIKLKLRFLAGPSNGRLGNINLILSSIFSDIIFRSNEVEQDQELSELEDFVAVEVLPSICESIRTMSAAEFEEIQESLLSFVLNKWEEACCFLTIYLISEIFAYVTQIAPDEIVEEYMVLFSKNSLPSQVKYFLLLAVMKHSKISIVKTPNFDVLSMELLKFSKIQVASQTESISPEDLKFIRLFWSRLKYHWANNFAEKILPICVQMVGLLPKLDGETIAVILIATQAQFRRDSVPPFSLLASAVLLHGLQELDFRNNSKEWDAISFLCTKLAEHCFLTTNCGSLPKPARYLILKTLCSFVGRVGLESEDMLESALGGIELEDSTKFLNTLEKLVRAMEEKGLELCGTEKERLKNVLSRLNNFCRDSSQSQEFEDLSR